MIKTPLKITKQFLIDNNLSGTIEERFWKYVAKTDPAECWEWLASKDSCGYGRLGNNWKGARATRVSWMLHNGSIPPGMVICHTCDNPGCVNPHHLFMGTMRDNSLDMIRKGRGNKSKGEKQHSHKLTEEIVRQIRADYAQMCANGNTAQGVTLGGKTGMSHKTLAAKYGVNRSSIRKIINRMTWKHI